MTDAEFSDWLDYHCQAFPGLAKWLSDAGPGAVDAWRRCLSMCRPADAYAATDAMLRDGPPEGYSRHPSEVFRRCNHARSRDIDDQDWRRTAVHCRECMDTGFIQVWHPDAVTAYEEGRLELSDKGARIIEGGSVRARVLRWAVARCACDRGQAMSKRVPVFDERRYIRSVAGYSVIRPADCEHFVRRASVHANRWRDAALDAYSAT